MLLDVDRAVGAGAPRASLVGEHGRRLEEVRGEDGALGLAGARRGRRVERSGRGVTEERGHALEVVRAARARGEEPDRHPRDRAQEARLRGRGPGARRGQHGARIRPALRRPLEHARRLGQDARVAPRAAGRRVERAPDGGDVPQPAIALRGGVDVLGRQAGGLEIRDRPREGLVPAERGPEQLEGEVLERQAALEEPQHPHPSQRVFAGSRTDARGAQHLARRHPDRDEPRAREGVGPIDADQLAPQRMRHPAARHQRGATGQRAVGRQVGDGAGPVAAYSRARSPA